MHTYIHTYMHACMHACIHMHIHIHMHMHMHIPIHIDVQIQIHIQLQIHTHTYITGNDACGDEEGMNAGLPGTAQSRLPRPFSPLSPHSASWQLEANENAAGRKHGNAAAQEIVAKVPDQVASSGLPPVAPSRRNKDRGPARCHAHGGAVVGQSLEALSPGQRQAYEQLQTLVVKHEQVTTSCSNCTV